MKLKFLAGEFAICQFSPDQQIPDWVSGETMDELLAIMKTPDEVTVVCSQVGVPEGPNTSHGWRCFRVDQTLSFDLVGVIAKLTEILALARIPVFVISTYNTDYVLIPGPHHQQAMRELVSAGYELV